MGLNRGVESAWWALRIGLGLTAFLAGLDKFFNVLTDWMVVGIAVLTAWTRLGSYVAMVWLRDQPQPGLDGTVLRYRRARCRSGDRAYTLARLTEARQPAEAFGITLTEGMRTPRGETAA
jgi:hypothetical protein